MLKESEAFAGRIKYCGGNELALKVRMASYRCCTCGFLLFEHLSVKLRSLTMLCVHCSLIFTKHIKPCCFISALRDLT